MRRSEMPQRKTPLTSSKPLNRTTALPASPMARSALHAQAAERSQKPKAQRRTPPAIPVKVRIALALRSGGVCEMALPGCTGRATDPAHRLARQMGGRKGEAKAAHDVLSNLTHSCRRCHQIATAEPAWAYSVGLALPTGFDPAVEWVLYRGAVRWLNDDGLVLTTNPNLAEEAA
jgi:hypothetical protein